MKKFLSDYGFTILTAIVVITLIAFGSPIGSTIQKQTANIVQSLGKVANNDLNKIDDSVSLMDLTNINKSGVIGDFSRKGNLVTINDTQYRVLDVNGTQVKVMSMESTGSSAFNSSSNTYTNSTLDTYLNETFYNSLPEAIRNAIVEQNISQSKCDYSYEANNFAFSSWYKGGFIDSDTSGHNYVLVQTDAIIIGIRKVYALDVKDIILYLGSNSTPQDVNEMFFNLRKYSSHSIWLRSNVSNNRSMLIDGYYGLVNCLDYRSIFEVRPAFVLDLSLLG